MKVLVLATPQVSQKELHSYDEEIGGTYEVALLDDTAPEDLASAALDGFHDKIAVKVLDDFAFTVHDPETGAQLAENEERKSYELTGQCLGVTQISGELEEKCVRGLIAASEVAMKEQKSPGPGL